MSESQLQQYERASGWALDQVRTAASHLDAPTPCGDWQVRDLLNHFVETPEFWAGSARGEDVSPPSGDPPQLIGDDPVAAYGAVRTEVLRSFGEDGAIERTGPLLGIAVADNLLHGWDLARASGVDAAMPEGLASAAYDTIHGRFTDDQRTGVFKPEIAVDQSASAQERLLAYAGRDASWSPR